MQKSYIYYFEECREEEKVNNKSSSTYFSLTNMETCSNPAYEARSKKEEVKKRREKNCKAPTRDKLEEKWTDKDKNKKERQDLMFL